MAAEKIEAVESQGNGIEYRIDVERLEGGGGDLVAMIEHSTCLASRLILDHGLAAEIRQELLGQASQFGIVKSIAILGEPKPGFFELRICVS